MPLTLRDLIKDPDELIMGLHQASGLHPASIATIFDAKLNLLKVRDMFPANTRRWPYVVPMLARRLRRRPNIKTTLGQRLVLSGIYHIAKPPCKAKRQYLLTCKVVHSIQFWKLIAFLTVSVLKDLIILFQVLGLLLNCAFSLSCWFLYINKLFLSLSVSDSRCNRFTWPRVLITTRVCWNSFQNVSKFIAYTLLLYLATAYWI